MMRIPLVACLAACSSLAFSSQNVELMHRSASFRLGFEEIKLPGNETMGMVGGTYLLEALPNFYLGPAAYGAMTGQRGGFFTGGFEAAYRIPLTDRLGVETGFYVGGGAVARLLPWAVV